MVLSRASAMAATILLACSSAAFAAEPLWFDPPTQTAWSSAGNGVTDDHHAPDEFFLDKHTVPHLSPRWVFTAGGEVWGTPTVERDAVYASDRGGSVWRIDARTGDAVWQTSLPALTGVASSFSRVSPAIGRDEIIVGDQATATVLALSKSTGALLWQTVLATNSYVQITSSPVILNGRVYVGVASRQEGSAGFIPGSTIDFRGSVAALDARTGHIIWQTYTVPAGYTGGAVWSSNIAVDTRRHALYVTTGNNYSVPPSVAACQSAATTPVSLDACLDPADHIDSILSLDANTGELNWAQRLTHADTWTTSCVAAYPARPCPQPTGLDTDFGAGANLLTIKTDGRPDRDAGDDRDARPDRASRYEDVVGAGQKSGVYWLLDRDSGKILWGTQVGPGGGMGGILWGTATDGKRIYVPSANSSYKTVALVPSGAKTNGGFWSALDPATGKILWQTATTTPSAYVPFNSIPLPPGGAPAGAYGSVSVAAGVMYGADEAGTFVALDTETGKALFSFSSGGSSISAPAIVNGTLYWSSGYGNYGPSNNKIYALSIIRPK